MTDPMMQQITQRVADEIRNSATDNDARATKLRDEATQHRARAAELRIEADGLEQRAKDAEANAVTWGLAAQVKRQRAAEMLGRPELPTPGMITPVGDLGMAVGALRMVPRADASPEELASFRDLMQAVHAEALHQQQVAAARLRDAQATIQTGQLAPEDIPQPDPLSGSPAEETGAHPVVPAQPVPVHRPWTPDREEVQEDGRKYTVVTMKRSCNGCGWPVGDATREELDAGGAGLPLPDVRGECPSCSPGTAVPDADADCDYCLAALVRVGGVWLHAQTMASECGPGSEHLTANPTDVRYRGEDADGPEPPTAKVPADPKPETARRGMRRIKGGRRRPRPAAPETDASPYTSFTGLTPDRVVAGRPAEPVREPRTYPDAPANGGPVERSDDPSALALDGEITQAFPAPVAEDGGESRG